MKLGELQEWFSHALKCPHAFKDECASYIKGGPRLNAYQRLEIYHQLYWQRLFNALSDRYFTVVCLLGKKKFEKLATGYLQEYPPHHWSLRHLGEAFPDWIKKNYFSEAQELVWQAALVDRAVAHAFSAPTLEAIDFSVLSSDEITAKKLYLQPFIHLFHFPCNFFQFREELISNTTIRNNANGSLEITYEDSYFVLYRSLENVVAWKKISYGEYWMLLQFQKGSTIEKACQELAIQEQSIVEDAQEQLPFWFKQWTVYSWFGLSSSSS